MGLRVSDFGLRVSVSGSGVSGFNVRLSVIGFSPFGCRVLDCWGEDLRVEGVEAHGGEREADEEEGRVLGEKHPKAHADRHQEMHLHVPDPQDDDQIMCQLLPFLTMKVYVTVVSCW